MTKTKPSKWAECALRRKLEPPNKISAMPTGQNHRSRRTPRWSIRASNVATQMAAINSATAARAANPSCRNSNSISASQQLQIKVTNELKIRSLPIGPPSKTHRRAKLRQWRKYQTSARGRPMRGMIDATYSSRKSPATVSRSRAASNRSSRNSAHRGGPEKFMTSPPPVLSRLATSLPGSFEHPQGLDSPWPQPCNSGGLALRESRCLSPAGN